MRAERNIVGLEAAQIIIDDPFQETERLFSLDTPSLQALAHILRHKELWPEGFAWNYLTCDTCAMGLAGQLWEAFGIFAGAPYGPNISITARVLDLPMPVVHRIFGGTDLGETYGVCDYSAVTPGMVADQIDKYLGTR